jgi:NADH pyrophosphatase NudC (nudix superfamily)
MSGVAILQTRDKWSFTGRDGTRCDATRRGVTRQDKTRNTNLRADEYPRMAAL